MLQSVNQAAVGIVLWHIILRHALSRGTGMASKHSMRTDLVCFGLIRWLETAPTARRCWPAQSM